MKKSLCILLLVLVFSVLGVPYVFGEVINRHPKGSDATTGYWCLDCHLFESGGTAITTPGESPWDTLVGRRWVKTQITLKSPYSGTVTIDYPPPAAGQRPKQAKGVSPYDGPCEACHFNTEYHCNSADCGIIHDANDHTHEINNPDYICTDCHIHFQEYMFGGGIKGPQAHATHLTAADTGVPDPKGPAFASDDCTACHTLVLNGPDREDDYIDYKLFGPHPGELIAVTTVCDPCHSRNGIYNGVDDEAVGAKPNWENGVYNANGNQLKAGKEQWCATCHDDGTSVIKGAIAPNVMGDNVTYSYNSSGHGRSDINVQCADCHTLSSTHTDGIQRTYEAAMDNYVEGYRLLHGMDIPRMGNYGAGAFELCFDCHSYADVLGPESNFWDDDKSWQFHELHLQERYAFFDCWDSDWDGEVDSAISCTACHNVHGSPMKIDATYFPCPVMIRHGELISSPEMDKVPALDFRWYDLDAITLTPILEESRYGYLLCGLWGDLSYNNVCWGCHNTGWLSYYRSPVHSVPVVNELRHSPFEPGKTITIIGYSFGAMHGDSVVHIGPRTYDYTSSRIKLWSDTKIRIKIPFTNKPCEWFKHGDGEYRRQKVWVTVGGEDSNVKNIKVMKPVACP